MNLLRRRSTLSGASTITEKLPDSPLLADVQRCFSQVDERLTEATNESVQCAIATLKQTLNPIDIDSTITYIGQKIKSDSHQDVMIALDLLGQLMLCEHPFFPEAVSSSPFILKYMSTIIAYQKKATSSQPSTLAQADRALHLVRQWADVFHGNKETKEIYELYRGLLKKSWVNWPPKSSRTIMRQQDEHTTTQSQRNSDSASPLSWMTDDYVRFKSILESFEAELDRVSNVTELEENALIPELVSECRKISPQLQSTIEILVNTTDGLEAAAPFIDLNDKLNKLFEKHQTLKKQRSNVPYNPFDDMEIMAQVLGQLPPTNSSSKGSGSAHTQLTNQNVVHSPFDDEDIL